MKNLRKAAVALRNRYYHRGIRFGKGTSLSPFAQIGPEVELGADCVVLEAALKGKCAIGDRTLVSSGVDLTSTSTGADCRFEKNSQAAGARLEYAVTLQQNADLCEVNVGAFSYIARGAVLNKVEVGRFCSIGPNCLLGAGDHPSDWVSTSPAFYSPVNQAGRNLLSDKDVVPPFTERRSITIGNDVWLGANVFVRDGVRIGDGAIVGAGAVVVRDVAPFSIVGGVPARELRHRFPSEVVTSLLQIKWWDWPESQLREAQPLIASGRVAEFLEFARSSRAGGIPK